MPKAIQRTDREIAEIYRRHGRMVYRISYAYMKNPADTEDAVQETFFRLIQRGPAFESEEHEKAWLIRTASNLCINSLRHWRRKSENIEDFYDLAGPSSAETDDVLEAVMSLSEKYRTVVYLYYYEGYTSVEIAEILKKPQSTIRSYLHEARAILRERLGEDFDEES